MLEPIDALHAECIEARRQINEQVRDQRMRDTAWAAKFLHELTHRLNDRSQ